MSNKKPQRTKQSELPTMEDFKKEAKEFKENNPHIKSHVQSLRELSRQKYGYENWETLRSFIEKNENTEIQEVVKNSVLELPSEKEMLRRLGFPTTQEEYMDLVHSDGEMYFGIAMEGKEKLEKLIEKYGNSEEQINLVMKEDIVPDEVYRIMSILLMVEDRTPVYDTLGLFYTTIGRGYLLQKDYKSAFKYAKGALELCRRKKNEGHGMINITIAYTFLFDVLYVTLNYELMMKYSLECKKDLGTVWKEYRYGGSGLEDIYTFALYHKQNGKSPIAELKGNVGKPPNFNVLFNSDDESEAARIEWDTRALMRRSGGLGRSLAKKMVKTNPNRRRLV